MYNYIDSPVTSLEPGARFFIWSARQWMKAAVNGRCVCGVISGAFRSFGAPEAVDDFHLAMRSLFQNAKVPLYFGSPERETVTEHEALLLCALSLTELGEAEVKTVARGMAHADMAPVLARALCNLAQEFARQGNRFAAIRPPRPDLPMVSPALRSRIDSIIARLPASLKSSVTPRSAPPAANAPDV